MPIFSEQSNPHFVHCNKASRHTNQKYINTNTSLLNLLTVFILLLDNTRKQSKICRQSVDITKISLKDMQRQSNESRQKDTFVWSGKPIHPLHFKTRRFNYFHSSVYSCTFENAPISVVYAHQMFQIREEMGDRPQEILVLW